ncbi:MAG: hypothetical protein ACI4RD_05340 [Kiritimatiellia bacterium]
MKIRELQEYLKDRLNAVEALVQGGCRAFAEDTRTVYDESAQFMSEGGVAVVVVTPKFARNGCSADGIPCDSRLQIRCMEMPPVATENSNALRALDAAELVAHALDSDVFLFQDIDQAVSTDRDGNSVVTATASFSTTINLTKGE